jgi:tetratricopeptide (TPR) repeat protein
VESGLLERVAGQQAEEACTILIDRGGNVAWAYTNRGSTHLAKKVSERAISDLNKAIKLDPKYFLAYD